MMSSGDVTTLAGDATDLDHSGLTESPESICSENYSFRQASKQRIDRVVAVLTLCSL